MNVHRLYDQALRYASHLEPQHWVIIFVVLIGVGAFFLRGFGSRAKY
jgi:hypothetical protein